MDLRDDRERAEYLQNLLVSVAVGQVADAGEYAELRRHFLDNQETASLTPQFLRTTRDTSQFWQFIKKKYSHYAERREYLWREFAPLLDHLEGRTKKPLDTVIGDGLKSFDAEGVNTLWTKALQRRRSDPEGAITAARTLLETVCKHILDASNVNYDPNTVDLPELYRLTAKELNLAPSQHTQETFKKILGGVTSVVNELGSLRNRLGDAHGQGKQPVRPSARHAQLAVNLAGTVALFLVETALARTSPTKD